jgi:hypothetical protein
MRTDDEIVARIDALRPTDFLGFDTQDLIVVLPFERAKKYLKPDAPADQWHPEPRDRESVLRKMRDYMPFAWEKANDCRGISASRSMSHYASWVWLLGDDLGDLTDYEHYGKDNLVRICEKYGWDHKQWDDSRRVNSDMED